MDAIYEINVAKSEFRDAYNDADVERLLSLFHDACVNTSDALPTASGAANKTGLRERTTALFAGYAVKLVPIVVKIVPCGDKMFDYGWHEFTLTPKAGGPPVRSRQRYMELWAKDEAGNWKIWFYMHNQDVRSELNGSLASWFVSERAEEPAATS